MQSQLTRLPGFIVVVASLLLAWHGPIAQLSNYHAFADQSPLWGVPHGANVLSNIGFAAVALWGLVVLYPRRAHPALRAGWAGYLLFLMGLLLTALGSGFYHLAPDNFRLLWDRLPIALACAGLLAGVRAETAGSANALQHTLLLALLAIASVAWWYISELQGSGDLRLYLLLQALPLVLIPLWQTLYAAPKADRIMFAAALVLYIIAKLAELRDHASLTHLVVLSGHTLKHLLATAAAGVLVWRLIQRTCASIPTKKCSR